MDDEFLTQVEKLAAVGRAQDLQFDGVVARVAVDQFCSLDRPSQAEIERFSALLQDALPLTDPTNAARIAEKLAQHPSIPDIVLARIAERGGTAAAIVFEKAPRLTTSLALARAEHGDCREAIAIAGRRDLDAPVVAALARRTEPEVLRALVANHAVHLSRNALLSLVQRGRFDGVLARAVLARGGLGLGALPLFLAADPDLRRDLILQTVRAELTGVIEAASPLAAIRQSALAAAGAANRNAFATTIALCLKSGRATVEKMIDDRGGEPLALIFAAIGAAPAVAIDAMAMLRPGAALDALPNVRLALEANPRAAWRIISEVAGRRGATRASEFATGSWPEAAGERQAAGSRMQRPIANVSRS